MLCLICLVFSCVYCFFLKMKKFWKNICSAWKIYFCRTNWCHIRRKNTIEISAIYWNVLLWTFSNWFKRNKFIANSFKNVGTIIWLLFCYNIAIIWIIVELYQKLYMHNKSFTFSIYKNFLRKVQLGKFLTF